MEKTELELEKTKLKETIEKTKEIVKTEITNLKNLYNDFILSTCIELFSIPLINL